MQNERLEGDVRLGGGHDPLGRLSIGVGSIADYARLSAFHYLAGPPATHVRVLAARDRGAETVGVLVVSMPTLDGAWRDVAWPGRYRAKRAGERSARLKRLNAEVRTISRVVVDPRWRGLGVARRLVEAYLADPLTERTEAVCAIGVLCPFFARAGMREVPVPVRRCTARLGDALDHVMSRTMSAGGPGATEGEEYLERFGAAALMSPGLMRRELRRWWREHKTTRERSAPVDEMAWEAFSALVSRRCAYVWEVEMDEKRVEGSARAASDGLAHPLTLFLTEAERSRVLAALRRFHRDRVRALLKALGVEQGERAGA